MRIRLGIRSRDCRCSIESMGISVAGKLIGQRNIDIAVRCFNKLNKFGLIG